MKYIPSFEALHERFIEDPPGVLKWREDFVRTRGIWTRSSLLAGSIVNCGTKSKPRYYHVVRIKRIPHQRSRIIFKMHHNKDPLGVIDHINGDSLDDRIENLRDVTMGENVRNQFNTSSKGKFFYAYTDRKGLHKVKFILHCPSSQYAEEIASNLELSKRAYIQSFYDEWKEKRLNWKGQQKKMTSEKKMTPEELQKILDQL